MQSSTSMLGALALGLLTFVGCATEENPIGEDFGSIGADGGGPGGNTAGGYTAGGYTAGGSTAGGYTAGGSTAGGYTAGGSVAGGDLSGGIGGGTGGGPGTALPPEVCNVLRNNACMNCHTDPVQGGAPMPLTLASHFGNGMGTKVLARVQDLLRPMPPPTSGRGLPSAADVNVLKSWINGGMQGVDGQPCGAAVAPDVGTDETPSWAQQPWPEGMCDEVFTIMAHQNAGSPAATDQGYLVPAQETSYQCFYRKVTWPTKVQVIAARARVEAPEDKKFVHHIVVSGVEPGQQSIAGASASRDYDTKPCDNPSGSTIGVWAPGALNPVTYPSDVGVKAPSNGAYIEMQVHYNNPSGTFGSRSKVAYDLCISKTPRANEAGVVWLGFENANAQTLLPGANQAIRLDNQGNGTAVGKCSVKQDARILWMAPHMHELGRHTKVEVVRKNGTIQTVLDKPFNFEEQTAYFRENLTLQQGDSVRTTCKWDTTQGRGIHFGFASKDEMCFVYTLVTPWTALQGTLGFGLFGERGFVGGELSCAAQAGP